MHYTAEDHATWKDLITDQTKIIEGRACHEFIEGLEKLNLPHQFIPSLDDLSTRIYGESGWVLHAVKGYISADEFFTLLANRNFPVATYIRNHLNYEYNNQPDIFHELFGHCPFLTQRFYANFLYQFANIYLKEKNPLIKESLSRIFCFTIELGIIKTNEGLKIYGAGLLSSKKEAVYSLESEIPKRYPFNLEQVIETPYQIETIQPVYYILDNFSTLDTILDRCSNLVT